MKSLPSIAIMPQPAQVTWHSPTDHVYLITPSGEMNIPVPRRYSLRDRQLFHEKIYIIYLPTILAIIKKIPKKRPSCLFNAVRSVRTGASNEFVKGCCSFMAESSCRE
jgi:hypothetical protein